MVIGGGVEDTGGFELCPVENVEALVEEAEALLAGGQRLECVGG